MEFHEKLQELRKQKALTQEELAEALYVSRAAISKWESGRGYPNIDSLKAISVFFGVTVDELLSGNEALRIAEEDHKQKEEHICGLVFGLIDLGVILLFFLPFFGQKANGAIQSVSLLSLTTATPYLKIAYYAFVIGIAVYGVLTLTLQNCQKMFWVRNKYPISLILSAATLLMFIISSQPYAATFLFLFLAIKVLLRSKRQ